MAQPVLLRALRQRLHIDSISLVCVCAGRCSGRAVVLMYQPAEANAGVPCSGARHVNAAGGYRKQDMSLMIHVMLAAAGNC